MTSQDPSVEAPKRGPRLRMLCVNDVYTLENLPRLATLAAELRAEDPGAAFVTTLAGDFVSPSLLSSLDGGRGMIDCMNGVPIDYVCFGNHEDDISAAELHARIGEFKGTWLSTNVLGFDPKLVTAAVLEIGRPEGGRHVRVGLVGVVMDDAAAYRAPPFGGATLLPPNDVAVAAAKHLYDEERCALVVPLPTHQPVDHDQRARALRRSPVPGHRRRARARRRGPSTSARRGSVRRQAPTPRTPSSSISPGPWRRRPPAVAATSPRSTCASSTSRRTRRTRRSARASTSTWPRSPRSRPRRS